MSAEGFRIGLDEAGYGPRLGPLVVGCVRASGQERGLASILRRPAKALPKIQDSKKLYSGNLAPLETVALAALACARGQRPRSLLEVLGEAPRALVDHPWYGPATELLPLVAKPSAVDAATDVLRGRLDRAGCALDAAEIGVVLEGDFNRRLAAPGQNKARLEMDVLEVLIDRCLPAGFSGSVLCDRLGGRKRYGDWLAGLFPFAPIHMVEERPRHSHYVVSQGEAQITFRFIVGGEDAEAEIALASCLAKYVREVMMFLFNRFWSRRRGLRPTAGYWLDAGRWMEEMAGDSEFERHRELMVRQR